MGEILIAGGWVLVGISAVMAVAWLVTLFAGVRDSTWVCVWVTPFVFWIGDCFITNEKIQFIPLVVVSLVCSLIPAAITGLFSFLQTDDRKDRGQSKKISRQKKEIQQSEEFQTFAKWLRKILSEDRGFEVAFSQGGSIVTVVYAETSPAFIWDGENCIWRRTPETERTFRCQPPRDDENDCSYVQILQMEREILEDFVDENIAPYARKGMWKKQSDGEWTRLHPRGRGKTR